MPDSEDTPAPSPSRALIEFTPVPRATNRADGWKPEVQRAFVEALADTGSVASACRMVGKSERSAYALRRHPAAGEFAAAWAAAQGHGVLRLQDAVIDRALNGVDMPLVYQGGIVGTYRKHDNRLAAFILRNHLPAQYGAEGGRAPHAIDAKKLARLKADWHAEWEAEQRRVEAEEHAGLADFVDRIEDMHVEWWNRCGPRTRAAYAHFRRLERIESTVWLEGEEDGAAALAQAEAQYFAVFADDARSLARKLGECCWLGDDKTWDKPEDGGEAE